MAEASHHSPGLRRVGAQRHTLARRSVLLSPAKRRSTCSASSCRTCCTTTSLIACISHHPLPQRARQRLLHCAWSPCPIRNGPPRAARHERIRLTFGQSARGIPGPLARRRELYPDRHHSERDRFGCAAGLSITPKATYDVHGLHWQLGIWRQRFRAYKFNRILAEIVKTERRFDSLSLQWFG